MGTPDIQIDLPMASRAAKAARVLEILLLFGLLPVLLAFRWLRAPLMPLLWLTALYCAWRLYLDGKLNARWLGAGQVGPGEWRRILATFALLTPVLLATVWAVRPRALFALPLHHPLGWLAVMALYPPLSACPRNSSSGCSSSTATASCSATGNGWR